MSSEIHGPLLVVEDSPEEFEATFRALRKVGLGETVRRCSAGEEALDYLLRRGSFAQPGAAPRPALVLLDLNMPGTDGREVLRIIKSEPSLRSIPVVVLTTSRHPRDVRCCYELGANTYLQRPVGYAALCETVALLHAFWFERAVLPLEAGA